MKRYIIISIIFIVVFGLIGFKLAANKKQIEANKKPQVTANMQVPVSISKASVLPVGSAMLKTGNLVPYKEADVMAVSAGKIVKLNFDLGTSVQQGTVLAQVDNALKNLSLEQTNLNITKLKNDKQRYTDLYKGNATTEENLTKITYDYDNAVNQAAQIQKQISDLNITAPVSGKIVKKNIENGEYVNAGTVVATVVDISRLKVQVMVNETEVYTLSDNQPVKISSDIYPGVVFSGNITYISPQGNDAHNYLVEVTLNNNSKSPLRAGTFVYADFSKKSNSTALQIPREALVESVKNPYVYVVENGRVKVRKLELGRDFGSMLEVVSGLSEGETVVTSGQINLRDGSEVLPVINK